MKIRKIFTSLAILTLALCVTASGAMAEVNFGTTTVDLDLKSDVSAIGATTGRTLNLTILGLNEKGNVDIFGESGGSSIIASVVTLLGVSPLTGTTPGTAAAGQFAAETKYVRLNQGIGQYTVTYPNSAQGTDAISVILFERRTDDGGNAVTRQIASNTLSVEVAAASPAAEILNIESFAPAASDANGLGDATPATPANENADLAIAAGAARMTANAAGGIFQVRAYRINGNRTYTFDATAIGSVTVTLKGDATATEAFGANRAKAATTYTATGSMVNGVANVSIPTGFTEAGRYTIEATMGDLGSTPHRVTNVVAATDYIDILPLGTPASVALSVNMDVVSNTAAANLAADGDDDGIMFDPTFSARMVDTFGNKIIAAGFAGATVKVTDANTKISDFNIVIPANANSATSVQDGAGFATGQASLTASVPANSLITVSGALGLKTVSAANQLAMNYTVANDADADLAAIAQTVGNTFQFVQTGFGVDADGDGDAIGETSALLATDVIRITNLKSLADGTNESLEVAVSDLNPDVVQALFTKPATAAELQTTGFLVQHVGQSYADCIVTPNTASALAFAAGSPNQAFLKDQAGNVVSEIEATVNANNSFTVTINAGNFSMKDAFGNTNNVGNVTAKSTLGTVSGSVQVGNNAQAIVINYPAGTTGSEELGLTFTQPGIASVNNSDGITVIFPAVSSLASFDTFPVPDAVQQLTINAAMPLTVFPRTEAGATLTVADGFFIDYDASVLELFFDADGDNDIDAADIALGAFVSGSNVGANTGRIPLMVRAKTTPGTYDVTVRSVDSTLTQTIQVEVVKFTTPLAVSSNDETIISGETATVNVTGGVLPYAASSSNAAVATGSVAGNTLTITAVGGGDAVITVTDANDSTVTVAVTVTGAVEPEPVPTEVVTVAAETNDEIAAAPVDLGSVATGGSNIGLAVSFPPYEAAVDQFVAVATPDGTLFFIDADGELTAEIVPSAVGVTDAEAVTVLDEMAACSPFGATVPTGDWSAYWLVGPAADGDLDAILGAEAYELGFYTFEVTCP